MRLRGVSFSNGTRSVLFLRFHLKTVFEKKFPIFCLLNDYLEIIPTFEICFFASERLASGKFLTSRVLRMQKKQKNWKRTQCL